MIEKRLLIIDDEPDLVEIARRAAERAGFIVKVVTTEDEFKAAATDFNPTVILLDIIMPNADGIELVKWLAEIKSKSKIIVATGFNPHYAVMAERLGDAQGLDISHLDKPFRVKELHAALG